MNKMYKKTDGITKDLESLKETAKAKYKAEIVGIFGSYVRGEQKESSDLDVLVRFLEGATLFDLVGIANFVEERLCVKVDIVPIDTVREEIKEHVLKEAIYL